MRYPVVIHKDSGSDYGVTVPDLPGCFSAGETVDEALSMAKDAIETHVEGLLLEGDSLPETLALEDHLGNPDLADAAYWALVEVDLTKLSGKTRRINVTVPDLLLRQIDAYVQSHNVSRSALMVQGALAEIGRTGDSSRETA